MLLPMFVLAMFTLVLMVVMGVGRLAAVRKGIVPGRYFRLMSGADIPDRMQQMSRHFSNLFETPVLFYVAAALFVALHILSPAAQAIAWLYVLLRFLHAAIHLTYNHPLHRMAVFFLGNFCTGCLWVILLVRYLNQPV